MNNEELIILEKKYFKILENIISSGLGRIISQVCSQKLYDSLSETEKSNVIDTAVENILEDMISTRLGWNTCSMPVRADSCYECGDAIVHIDAKTILSTDNDAKNNKIVVEKAQTSFNSEYETFASNKKGWKPKLKFYEKHYFYGIIPNLTYFIKIIYSKEHLVEKISLISIPNGQLFDIFSSKILGAGKSVGVSNNNIRFAINKIKDIPDQQWRESVIFERVEN